MWLKFFLPMALIGMIYWVGRRHGSVKIEVPALPPPRPMTARRSRALLGFILAAVMLIVGYVVNWWMTNHAVMHVRVVNTQAGNTTVFQAQRHLIYHRTFETVDGLKITLADTERMEVSPRD